MTVDKSVRKIHTESDIDAYSGYIPDDWSEKFVGFISEGSVMDRLLLDLVLSWRCASYTAQLPASLIRAIHAAGLGRKSFVSPDSSIVAYSDRIIEKLTLRVPDLIENRLLRAKVMKELVTLAAEFRDHAATLKHEYPIEPIWAQFMEDVAFRISLWASQRVAYVAFYNAYEAFIVDCLKVVTGLSSLRSTDKKVFNEALRTGMRSDVSSACWSHHEINIARLIRHALSHNGGRETEDLKRQKHGVMLIGGELQIVAEDNHRMLRRLRNAVEVIVDATRVDQRFLVSATKLPQPQVDDE